MSEKQPGLYIERTPREYAHEDLQRDIEEWMNGPAMGSEEHRQEMKAQPFSRQFVSYQNNFWTMVKDVARYIQNDGSLNEEVILRENKSERNSLQKDDPRWSKYVEYYEHLIEVNHAREIYNICKNLGYDPEAMKNLSTPLSAEQAEMIQNIWIEMRRLGFNRMDLIG